MSDQPPVGRRKKEGPFRAVAWNGQQCRSHACVIEKLSLRDQECSFFFFFLSACVVMRCLVYDIHAILHLPFVPLVPHPPTAFVVLYILGDWHGLHTRRRSIKERKAGYSGTKVQTIKCNGWTEVGKLYGNECMKSQSRRLKESAGGP